MGEGRQKEEDGSDGRRCRDWMARDNLVTDLFFVKCNLHFKIFVSQDYSKSRINEKSL